MRSDWWSMAFSRPSRRKMNRRPSTAPRLRFRDSLCRMSTYKSRRHDQSFGQTSTLLKTNHRLPSELINSQITKRFCHAHRATTSHFSPITSHFSHEVTVPIPSLGPPSLQNGLGPPGIFTFAIGLAFVSTGFGLDRSSFLSGSRDPVFRP